MRTWAAGGHEIESALDAARGKRERRAIWSIEVVPARTVHRQTSVAGSVAVSNPWNMTWSYMSELATSNAGDRAVRPLETLTSTPRHHTLVGMHERIAACARNRGGPHL